MLWWGAVVAVRCHRVADRVVEERLETRDGVTVRVPHVLHEGRVDVTAMRRVLGLLAVRTERLPDVVGPRASVGPVVCAAPAVRGSGLSSS